MAQNNQPHSANHFDETVARIEKSLNTAPKASKNHSGSKNHGGLGSKVLQIAFAGAAAINTCMAVDWRPGSDDKIIPPEPQRAPLVQTDNAIDVARKDTEFQIARAQHVITSNKDVIQEASMTGLNAISALGLGVAAFNIQGYRKRRGYNQDPKQTPTPK